MPLLANQTETMMNTRDTAKRKLDVPNIQVRNEKLFRSLDQKPVRRASHNSSDNYGLGPLNIETSLVSHRNYNDGSAAPQKTFVGSVGCTDESTTSSMISNLGPRKKAVLVIDDSSIICKVFQRALTKLGFVVKLAENGMEGLQKMQRYTFDLVFCDFLMPIMDGLDCVQQYRDWEKKHRPWFQQVRI